MTKRIKKEKAGKKIESKWNKIHYVCSGGCRFVSNDPGKCNSTGCIRARNPLSKCECRDGKHEPWIYYNDPSHQSK